MPASILVIDDHDATRDLIQVVLTQQGYRTRGATNGEDGIIMAREELPDLIMLDANMPGIDGFETCRRLRSDSRFHKVPIIMFTAQDQVTDKIAGFEAGVDDFLIKPTTPKELLQRVSTLLERVASGLLDRQRLQDAGDEGSVTLVDEAQAVESSSSLVHMAGPGELPTGSGGLGRVIAVMGSRGGAGATTLAINLAYALAEQGVRVILADLDMRQGHIATYLQLPTHSGLHNLAAEERMSLIRRLKGELVPAAERLEMLLTRANLDGRFPTLKPSQVSNLVGTLRRYSQCAIVDVGRGLSATTQLILSQTDRLLLCSRPERVALTATRQLLQHIDSIDFRGRTDVVLLDFEASRALPRQAIESFLKQPLLGLVPIDTGLLAHAVNNGQALWQVESRQADFATAIAQLARELVPA